MKSFITLLLAVTLGMGSHAKTTRTVWENPATECGNNNHGDGFFLPTLDVTKVETDADETAVYITASLRSDYPNFTFKLAKDTYLTDNGVKYPIVSAEGIELDVPRQTGTDNRHDFVLHFKPLPVGTRKFDLVSGSGDNACQIKGIMPKEERHKIFFPSYWRNEETGDWDIAFFDNCVIYDCKFWDYKTTPDTNAAVGKASFTISDGNDEMEVKVGKDNKGKRTIQIGNRKALYSMITSRFMPDYPTKDIRAGFVDNGYKQDTITLTGWLKDMPEAFKEKKAFDITIRNIFTGDYDPYYGSHDSLGRFTVKIPVINSSEATADWKRCFVRTIFEPGKRYFLMYDFKEGRRLFMGDDARLQNELIRFPDDWASVRMEKGDELDKYILATDSLIKTNEAKLQRLCDEHPTLSTRFIKYRREMSLSQQALNFGQARFNMPHYRFTDNARQYAYQNFWTKMGKPYTLHREWTYFINDFLDEAWSSHYRPYHFAEHIEEIAANAEDLATLKEWKRLIEEVNDKINAVTDNKEKQNLADKWNKDNADLIARIENIFQKSKVSDLAMLDDCRQSKQLLDSLGADDFIKSIYISKKLYNQIDVERKPMGKCVIDSVRQWIKYPIALDRVTELNEKYIALANKDFDRLVLKSNDDVSGISEGEAILKKILEPHKGKVVLLDVWGTWCSPCKEALSHSAEEYKRLAQYNIAYVYLANNSQKESWENVIKEYNVTGDNVAHYNLPKEQQAAVERYLKVNSFPTYKIFDKNGNLLDIKVDARNLDSLEEIVKKLDK